MAVKMDVPLLVLRERFGFGDVVQEAREPERGLAREQMFQLFVEMGNYGG